MAPEQLGMVSAAHVKRGFKTIYEHDEASLPNTEIPEHDIEHIFDVDAAGDAADGAEGEAEVFG
jgi:hypothetical protein